MILYDNQDLTTEVFVHDDTDVEAEVITFTASQVFLAEGAYIIVGLENIVTFNANKYSVTLGHNVEAIKALADIAEDQFWVDHEKNNGVTH
jgi:hypothetical protein